jgi:hypothetical protein
MLSVNKYIFVDVCDKNIDSYYDIINTVKTDYFRLINEVKVEPDFSKIRNIVHTLIGICVIFIGTNAEILYILKNLLELPKSQHDFDSYKYYVNMLVNFNTDKMF